MITFDLELTPETTTNDHKRSTVDHFYFGIFVNDFNEIFNVKKFSRLNNFGSEQWLYEFMGVLIIRRVNLECDGPRFSFFVFMFFFETLHFKN